MQKVRTGRSFEAGFVVFPIFVSLLTLFGCGGPDDGDAAVVFDVGGAGSDASGSHDPDASITGDPRIRFVSPSAGIAVTGQVPVRIEADEIDDLLELELVRPEGVSDTADERAVFEGVWDARGHAEGEVELQARATLIDGTLLFASCTVRVVHSGAGTLTGLVSLGRPIGGATVEVVAFDGLEEGAILGTAVTEPDGFFDVALEGLTHPTRILVRASGPGATTTEVVGDEPMELSASDQLLLTVPYDPEEGLVGVVVNGLSTLSTHLALAYAGMNMSPETAVDDAEQRLVAHLMRPRDFDVNMTAVSDVANVVTLWPEGRTASGLFHGALSRMAQAWTEEHGVEIRTVRLLRGLVEDLRADARFDGAALGVPIVIAGVAPLDEETTRWELARRADEFVETFQPNEHLNYGALSADDGFYTLVSTDTGPLYISQDFTRYDREEPSIVFSPPTPEAGQWLSSTFTITARVSDASELTSLTLEHPSADAVTAGTTQLHNGVLTATIDVAAVPEGLLDVRVRAVDASDNSAEASRTVGIDVTRPTLQVQLPGITGDPQEPVVGQAVDAGSGVASVLIAVGSTPVEVVADEDGEFSVPVTWQDGDNAVSIRAIDVAGNESEQLVQTITLDRTPPVLTLLAPTSDGWVGPGSFVVRARATDSAGVQSVVATAPGDVVLQATHTTDEWQAEVGSPAADGPFTLSITATDAVDNEAVAWTTLHRDGTPPVFGEVTAASALWVEDVLYVRTASAALQCSVSDAGGSGVASVCSQSPCNGVAATGDTWTVTVGVSEADTQVALTATDAVGNTSQRTVVVRRDEHAPTCELQPLGDDGWVNDPSQLFTVQAADGGAGVASVLLDVDDLTVPLVFGDGGWMASVALEQASTTVTARCVDALGNQAVSEPLVVKLDQVPPTVTLESRAFFGHEDATVSYVNGEFSVAPDPGTPVVRVSAAFCDQGTCTPAWPLFGTALRYDDTRPLADQNLPVFAFLPSDANPGTPDDELEMEYRFRLGDDAATTGWAEVPELDGSSAVPVALPFITDGPVDESFQWTADTLPTAIEVRVHDRAGNTAEYAWAFELHPLAPPVFLERIPTTGSAPDIDGYALGTGQLSALFSPGASGFGNWGGARVERFRVINPHAMDTVLYFDVEGSLTLQMAGERAFLKTSSAVNPLVTCGDPSCPMVPMCLWNTTPAVCDIPGSVDTDALQRTVTAPSELRLFSSLDASADSPDETDEGGYLIPAGTSSRVLALVTRAAGKCHVEHATSDPWYSPGSSSSTISQLDLLSSESSCSGSDAHAAGLTCEYKVVSSFGLTYCAERQYEVVRVVTSVRVRPESATSSGLWTLPLRHRLPGWSDARTLFQSSWTGTTVWQTTLPSSTYPTAPY